jgi:hypothetical protein
LGQPPALPTSKPRLCPRLSNKQPVLTGGGAIAGHSFLLKTACLATATAPWALKFAGRRRHVYCIPQQSKMGANQVIRPEIMPPVNGGQGGNPDIGKIRRKLGLTFVLSNPFRVPVTQSPIEPEDEAVRKMKKESI